MWRREVPFSTLIGKTLTAVQTNNDDVIVFTCDDGSQFSMHHEQDCCERVEINDINGDLQSLVGSPILVAEESCSHGDHKNTYDESSTWTFYKLATIKGHVDIRWYGTSNGYYSERVGPYLLNAA